MITVYGISNCNKIRDTKKFLKANGADFEFVDIRKKPLSEEKLDEVLEAIDLHTLVNKRGMKWRTLGLGKRDDLGDEELKELLLEHQVMITRPLIEHEGTYYCGYDEELLEELS